MSSRRRNDKNKSLNTSSGEDAALDSIARRAEEMLQEKRKERERARRIRLQELEKKQREEENNLDRQYTLDKKTGTTSTRPKGGSTSGSTKDSRRSSLESEDSTDGRDRDIKVLYNELDEKYRRSMMTNAQLDNEKQALVYQVEDLKDLLNEMEESTFAVQRELKDKQRSLDGEKRKLKTKEMDIDRLRAMVEQRDTLLKEHKLIMVESEEPPQQNGHSGEGDEFYIEPEPVRAALLTEELMDILTGYTPGTLEDKVRSVLNENAKLKRELCTVKEDLESEREQASKRPQRKQSDSQLNGDITASPQIIEMQRESSRQISEYKLKVQKAELDIAALESSVARLESQVRRYKEMAEQSEQAEDELKSEKRKMTRELREAQQLVEELETQKSHLQNRLDRIRQARKEVLGSTDVNTD